MSHPQAPPTHAAPLGHAFPQLPQFPGSVHVSLHCPPSPQSWQNAQSALVAQLVLHVLAPHT